MWIDEKIVSQCKNDLYIDHYFPESPCVVLGSSNEVGKEIHLKACKEDGIPVYRRLGGGGSVVLHPNSLVVSIGTWVHSQFKNDFFFQHLNQTMIDTLCVAWPVCKELYQSGISDIAFQEKKIAGTSLFRSRNYLLYQASILIDPRVDLIERYLSHPSKEPNYRKGRGHKDFLTSLREILDEEDLTQESIEKVFAENVEKILLSSPIKEELHKSQEDQVEYLLKRSFPTL